MFVLAFWAKNSFSQMNDNDIINEDFVAFRYDGNNPVECPAFVSIEKMEENEVERKEYHYGSVLPNGIGLPALENLDVNRCREIFESLESNLIKEDCDDSAYLINPDWNGHWSGYLTKDDTLAHLVNPDWDGAHNA